MRISKFFFILLIIFISALCAGMNYNKSNYLTIKEKADRFYRYKDYKKAVEHYFDLLEYEQKDESIHGTRLKIALCYFYDKEYKKSLEYLNKYDSTVDDYVDYFSLLCYKNLNDSDNFLKKLSQFKKNYRRSLLMNDIMTLNAEFLSESGKYSNSNKILIPLSRREKDKKKLQKILTLISDNYFKLGKYKQAVKYYKKIIDNYPFEPISGEALEKIIKIRAIEGKTINEEEILLGISLYISKRNYKEAYDFYNKYSPEMVNKKNEKEFEKGRILYYLTRYDDAIEIFKKIISNNPDLDLVSRSLLFKARAYFRKGDLKNSIKDYNRYSKLFPRNTIVPEVFWKLGWIYEGKRDFNNAIKYYRINTRRRNNFRYRSQWRIGFCYYKMKKYHNAIKTFNVLINKKNISEKLRDNALYWKAKSYEKLGDIKNSKICLKILTLAEFPNYYTFKAAEKLNADVALTDINPQKNKTANKIDFKKYPKIRKGEIVGKVFGKDYGVQILNDVRKKKKNTLELLENLLRAYENIGATSRAIRVSIAIKDLYINGKISYDYDTLIRKVYPNYYEEEILKTVKDSEIEPSVVFSIMRRESAFESDVLSSGGAVGLLELLPDYGLRTSRRIGRNFVWEDLIDPEINILLGYEHFKSLLKKYKNNFPIAFASYNAGEYNVNKWIN